ncbi:IucA/IucC family C-terminal-domain containing protein [Salininema proteolyticum]|uniref:IucA/IucC family C-terminal-domain containing protein n=1 Tax=Salininema proteolyticum TaxID=1607685 RepID=A0ABV8TV33_9ACTN
MCAATADPNERARRLELIPYGGHPLHPSARTRLGWTEEDMRAYDADAPRAVGLIVARDRDRLLKRWDPERLLEDDQAVFHPWQWEQGARDHFTDTGQRLRARPTASVRTLYVPDLGQYVKCSLGITITSTRRTVSARTARLTPLIAERIEALALPGHRVLRERASVWHPEHGEHTAIVRAGLPATHERILPAHVLPAPSPLTGRPVADDLVAAHGDAEDWWRRYVAAVVPPVLHLAVHHGIALEAHGQNSLVAFDGAAPASLWSRDFGGIRLHRPDLPPSMLPDGPSVWDADLAGLYGHISASLVHNHLAPLASALAEHWSIDWWGEVGALIDTLDLPASARDFLFGPVLPGKALLTAKLKGVGSVYMDFPNPMRRA